MFRFNWNPWKLLTGWQESGPQFGCETAEGGRGGVGTGGVAGVEDGSRGGCGRLPGSLQERQLALQERRLLLEERRLQLEERRVQHDEWRAAMDRETHQVDMDMKRFLLKYMRRADSNWRRCRPYALNYGFTLDSGVSWKPNKIWQNISGLLFDIFPWNNGNFREELSVWAISFSKFYFYLKKMNTECLRGVKIPQTVRSWD